MRIISVQNVETTIESVRSKAVQETESNRNQVQHIINDVRENGDKAVKYWDKKFSKIPSKADYNLRISRSEIKTAYSKVTKGQIAAIKLAKKRLEKSEFSLKNNLKKIKPIMDGIKITKTFVPLESVGCYIPGGIAKYPSTAIMSIVPAKVAGIKRIVAVSPPNSDSTVDPLVLVASDICGVDEFYRTGGPQAVAALAYGIESIKKVDKIVGPGGTNVTIAKSIVSDQVSIDMVAGPTELAIIADNSADSDIVASDLISQAEHGPNSMCCLITTSKKLAESVNNSLEEKIPRIERSDYVRASLEDRGFIAICKTEANIIEFANKLAPEHLQIITKNPKTIAQKIISAGLVLVGRDTPSSASDYLLGSNHILPTNGFAKSRSSLGVLDFMKIRTQLETSQKELRRISKHMKILTNAEGLPNHYKAVWNRLK